MIPDAIPPRLGRMALQFFDILSKIRLLSKLGIDISSEFSSDFFFTFAEDLPQILLELIGLKDPEITQQNVLSV